MFLRVLPRRDVWASALLMSTKLTFVVAAVQIGLERGGPAPATASALVTAAMVTVVALPGVATWLLRDPVTVSEP